MMKTNHLRWSNYHRERGQSISVEVFDWKVANNRREPILTESLEI